MNAPTLNDLSDRDLLAAARSAAADERRGTAALITLLAEVDARRLYLGEGCASLFTFCTQVLHLSEHAAYHRIEAARASRRFPMILELLSSGAATLTSVALLRPHLTPANHEALLTAARHKSKRDVELQIATLAPKPDLRPLVRKVASPMLVASPTPTLPASQDAEPATGAPIGHAALEPGAAARPAMPTRPSLLPLAEDRYVLRITIDAQTQAKLRRAQDLLGHSVPNGDPAAIIDRALAVLVRELERVKLAKTDRPRAATPRASMASVPAARRSSTRHIPAAVKRAVWERDQGRCAFEGRQGRCSETGRLEVHHLIPFACGGPSTLANLALRCRAHNSYEGALRFGPRESRAPEQ